MAIRSAGILPIKRHKDRANNHWVLVGNEETKKKLSEEHSKPGGKIVIIINLGEDVVSRSTEILKSVHSIYMSTATNLRVRQEGKRIPHSLLQTYESIMRFCCHYSSPLRNALTNSAFAFTKQTKVSFPSLITLRPKLGNVHIKTSPL